MERKVTQKFTRNELKGLIKECLIEILQEGASVESVRPRQIPRETDHENVVRRNISEKISFLPNREKMQRSVPPKINEGISNITSDPVMQDIFSDTASRTLVEQTSAERGGSGYVMPNDAASKMVANSDPTDLFSGSSDKWASLAFGETVKRR